MIPAPRLRRLVAVLTGSVLALGTALTLAPLAAAAPPGRVPVISPTPREVRAAGPDLPLAGRVAVVVGTDTDPAARDLLLGVLRERGARPQVVEGAVPRGVLTFHLGGPERADVRDALGDTAPVSDEEGYALRVTRGGGSVGRVALAGADGAGQFYAVQTLRQVLTPRGSGWRVAGVEVRDAPAMALRGTIEGFYGKPWSQAERLDQLAFYGQIKANTYIYAPKDDPYHRERWRDPYPAEKLAELRELVEQAAANHVRFSFALSPGNTICFSGESDRAALLAKFEAMYAAGVRAFSIPLDDIALQFRCAADTERYGAANQGTVGRAQAELLSFVQREFVATKGDVYPLQTVPTQYGDLTETPYKAAWREYLDPAVVVMWTGTDVVPSSITVEQTERIGELFGREVFVWDNYPVNDFAQTAGRLLLGPYDHREPGLSDTTQGIVSNPMNQAYASKPVIFTMADFAWNDRAYDPKVSGAQAARFLADGDPEVAAALETFVDLNHAAPRFNGENWLPQAPRLAAELARFWDRWDADPPGALAELDPVVTGIEEAPALIRAGTEAGFVADADRNLTATTLWGESLRAAYRLLGALDTGDADAAERARAEMDRAAAEAAAVRSEPGKTRIEGPVKIGDGVLDVFIADVAALHDRSMGLEPLVNASRGKQATAISQWGDGFGPERAVDGNTGNLFASSGREVQPWWQVDLGGAFDVESVAVYNRADCCTARLADYWVLTSERPFPDSLDAALADPAVTKVRRDDVAGVPTTLPWDARARYVRIWFPGDDARELDLAEVEVLGRAAS